MRSYEVSIMSSKNLERNVKLYIKVPEGYEKEAMAYPVLYVHDGNVIFNDFEEVDLTWGMMDDYLNEKDRKKIIIVGIGSGETRNQELFPFSIKRKDKEPIGGGTDLYMKFIIEELKPYINATYRTITSPDACGLLGVSVGGAATIYAAAKYQEHFSRFAFISSCHYPVQSKLLELVNDTDLSGVKRMYSDVGTEEHENEKAKETYLRTNNELYEVLKTKLQPDVLMCRTIEGSKHEFEFWNKRFPEIMSFLFN